MTRLYRASKYGNQRTDDGYASKAEKRRAAELALLQTHGQIRDLQEQVRIPLVVTAGETSTKVGDYVADFVYDDARTGVRVYEDVKGVRTPVYRLKKRLVKAIWGIEITEVQA